MRVSDNGIGFIKRHEGCMLTAYKCPAGVLTIGYGHTEGVHAGMTISESQADMYLRHDLTPVEACVSNAVGGILTQNQFDALCSFTFNVGCRAFLGSTLLAKVRANPCDPAIRNEFCRWIRGGGKILPGLVKRREEEAALYFA